MPETSPRLSVVAVTRDTFRTLRPLVAALEEQTIASSIELVVVAPSADAGAPGAGDVSALHSCRVVEAGPIEVRGAAAALGVDVATAPIVALSENHCFPDPDWAQKVLDAHDGPWVGVGPAVLNANPETLLSVALMAAGYGPFHPSMPAEAREELPLHNSSYRKDVLQDFGEDLGRVLADERLLQGALRQRGLELRFDPRPRKRHINEATWFLFRGLAYSSGRRYGGYRASDWGLPKRLAYAAAAPLLTIPITANLMGKTAPGELKERGVRLWATIWGWAALHALGEAVSYVAGARASFPFVEDEEFFIRERLGGRALGDARIAALVARLDTP